MLRAEITALQQRHHAAEGLRADNRRLAAVATEVEMLQRDDAEFKMLEQTIQQAQRANAEAARAARVNESRTVSEANARAEIERMNREGNALVNEYKVLTARTKDPALTDALRAQADADAKLKLAAIQAKQREIQAYIAAARASNLNVEPAGQTSVKNDSGKVVYYPGTAYEYSATAEGEQVSFQLPKVDCPTALSALETMSGRPIVRDPSLAHVAGTLDLRLGTRPKDNALQALRSALKEQLNVIVEPRPDGSLLAKLGPPR